MEGRRWEELNRDCVVCVLEKVGIESLILNIPFVCKSWYKASLDPHCWKILDFYMLVDKSEHPFIEQYIRRYNIKDFSATKFMKFVTNRSCSSATELVLPPHNWTLDGLDYITEECPGVKRLRAAISIFLVEQLVIFARLVGKFKYLELLQLGRLYRSIQEILIQINLHCHEFDSLCIQGYIRPREASTIVTYVPNIKCLYLQGAVYRDALVAILQGCRELDVLELTPPVGSTLESDQEILNMASHIKFFSFKCSIQELDIRKYF